MKVLLISGKAESGKDTFAKLLENELKSLNKRVLICHYADLVKYIARTFFDWNGEKDDYGRTLLQEIGTDKVRKEFPNFWVSFIVDILQVFKDKWDYVLIPDTRFPNEIEVPIERSLDVSTIRIKRNNHKSNLSEEQLNHPSETALDNWNFDYVIQNGCSMEVFKNTVEYFVFKMFEEGEWE